MKTPIEGIGTYHLALDTGYHLDLYQTLYVLLVSRNLISLLKLDIVGISFKIGNGGFSLFKNVHLIGSGILSDGLYKLKLDYGFAEFLLIFYHNVGMKHSM